MLREPNFSTGRIAIKSTNQSLFNTSCQTQLETAETFAMYTQYKNSWKIKSYQVLRSVTSFAQHAYKKVSVTELQHLGNKFFTASARP